MHPLVAIRRIVPYVAVMDRDLVIATLRCHQRELRQRGVLHAAVDVANRGSLKPRVRSGAERDAVYAF